MDVDPDGPPVALAAWPDKNHTVGPWGPPCSHSRPDCVVTMNAAPQRECAFEVVAGKTLTLNANNSHSAKFLWDGPCVPDGRSCKNLS